MSLDVYLTLLQPVPVLAGSGIFVREEGQTREISREEWDRRNPEREPVVVAEPDESMIATVYSANITHNLNSMADEAGIYQALWRPEEIGVTRAEQLVPLLTDGLARLKAEPERYEALNPDNGWGSYSGLVAFVSGYLEACKANQTATVSVSR